MNLSECWLKWLESAKICLFQKIKGFQWLERLLSFVWKVCMIVHRHSCRQFYFLRSITQALNIKEFWDSCEIGICSLFFSWKSHCKLPAALTQMHLPVGFHPTTAAFHLTSPSMTPFLVFQHYGPLEEQKVLHSLSLDKLSNEFSITWQWHRVYTMEPIPRAALSMPVTLVLERSGQYSRMVSSEFGG